MKQALREIAKLEGPFKRDRLEHAMSTLDNLERIAKEAIALECEHPTATKFNVAQRDISAIHWCDICGAIRIDQVTHGGWQLPEWSA